MWSTSELNSGENLHQLVSMNLTSKLTTSVVCMINLTSNKPV
ncbi:hypothetical protein BVRB_4g079380 [Beta vulgaris subsp. vulgaris]|nr:hypothetical protein BVRB_4g079380 [Beta vulgaris subsp. vulgaris]